MSCGDEEKKEQKEEKEIESDYIELKEPPFKKRRISTKKPKIKSKKIEKKEERIFKVYYYEKSKKVHKNFLDGYLINDGKRYLILIDGDNGKEIAKDFVSFKKEIKIINKQIFGIKRFEVETENEISKQEYISIQQEWKK